MPSRLRITNRHGPLQTIRPQHAAQHHTRADPATTAAVPASRIREVTAGRISPNITHLITAVHRGIIIPQTNTTAPHPPAHAPMLPKGQRQEHRQKSCATPSLSRPRSLTRPGPPATASRWPANEMTPHKRISATPKLQSRRKPRKEEKPRFICQIEPAQLSASNLSRRAAKTITVAKLRKQRKKPTAFLPRVGQGSQVKPARLPRNPTSANRDVPKRLTSHPSARPHGEYTPDELPEKNEQRENIKP
ncbi:hypothetical protein CKAH01_17792 [Colletotrichum kahawae]|uniref:Uncharacterized protein n=1 Tax=Colletotrichum kahawae TaxID=34407 RepID=A0AAD9YC40_COLKA|nr:hypothetical protein CKAH01_17792 [Colletotrichum kahawae]